jgi:hypothetical protein
LDFKFKKTNSVNRLATVAGENVIVRYSSPSQKKLSRAFLFNSKKPRRQAEAAGPKFVFRKEILLSVTDAAAAAPVCFVLGGDSPKLLRVEA